jgi:hypothetical protein
MPSTPANGFELLVAEQAQKHVSVNEALRLVDALVRTRVEEQGLTGRALGTTGTSTSRNIWTARGGRSCRRWDG